MNALLNHVPVPFFDRVPPRAKKALLGVFDGITDQAWPLESAYRSFINALAQVHCVDGPNFHEFTNWYWRVRHGQIDRPHPSEIYCATDAGEPVKPQQPTRKAAGDGKQIIDAITIVKAAHTLFEAERNAGYSPLALKDDDEIVADALREVLGSAAAEQIMDADMPMTTGNLVADFLLAEGSSEIDSKLVDCLTMTMQPELCAILVRKFTSSGH